MSKFFQALEQAERERALRDQAGAARGDTAAGVDPRLPAEPPDGGARPIVAGPFAALSPETLPRAAARAVEATPPPGIDPHLVSLLDPGAHAAEPYRALRHLVEQRRKVTGLGGVLVVTSPGVGDGKTTTAINLAGALAQDLKARVLLIEGDLRNPVLAGRLGLHEGGGRGLIDAILDTQVTLEDVVEPCPPFNLDILPAGRHRGVPYELLASPRFAELLQECRRRYDYVLIDSPPLVPFPDGRLLSGSVDGYLLVVSARHTPRKLVEEALGLLDPAKLVGLVFNGEERPVAGYYYYYTTRRPAPAATGGNGHSGPGWLAAVLPRRRARRDRTVTRGSRP